MNGLWLMGASDFLLFIKGLPPFTNFWLVDYLQVPLPWAAE